MAPTAARRKRVVVQRSPIHNLGLFARERIDKGALVIEYTGELLRSKLADFRERK
jgi:histone-lysine N-methyltransferase SETD1